MNPVKPLLLAAGRGSRMGELTEAAPKYSLKFNNKSLLEHLLTHLEPLNCLMPTIVTGYCPDYPLPGCLETCHNPNWESSNMLESLILALEKNFDDEISFLILYTDIFFTNNFLPVLLQYRDTISVSTNTLWRPLWQRRMSNIQEDVENFRMNTQCWVTDIGGRPSSLDLVQGQFMGVLFVPASQCKLFLSSLREHLKAEGIQSSTTNFLKSLIACNIPIKAVPVRGGWLEFDTRQDYNVYMEMIYEDPSFLDSKYGLRFS